MSNSEIAEYITELRVSHGYSQLYLSEVLGIGRQAYSHYETGRNMPTYQSVVKMAELYDIATDEFISKMHLDASKRSELEACFRIMKDQEKRGHVIVTDHSNQTEIGKPASQTVKSPTIKVVTSYMEKLGNEKQKKVLELIKWYVDN